MIRTKIIATLGPASENPIILERMAKAGLNIARLNFSHGDHNEHLGRLKSIREVNSKLLVPIATMLDTQGPEIRLGKFMEKTNLLTGEEVTLTTKDIISDKNVISISYKKLPETVKIGDIIYIADGTIELKVKHIINTEVICEIMEGGEVNTKKNVNLAGAIVDLPSIGEKDVLDIKFAAEYKMDFIAQSFVRTAKDVMEMKKLLSDNNSDALVIAKIEDGTGLKNLDEILKVADGCMVARGDLGVSIPIEQVPNAQKLIVRRCNEEGKPVIVATQMLESMTKNPRPTRAEVTDVANAIMDGADAIMLSGETAAGKFPVKAIEMMTKVATHTEQKMNFRRGYCGSDELSTVEDSLSRSVCETAHEVRASAIITCTLSGHTARMISRYKPSTTIIAVTPSDREIRKLNLWWGVHPLLIENPKNTDDLIQNAIDSVIEHNLVKKGSSVVLTAGIPFTIPGNMNLMKVHIV